MESKPRKVFGWIFETGLFYLLFFLAIWMWQVLFGWEDPREAKRVAFLMANFSTVIDVAVRALRWRLMGRNAKKDLLEGFISARITMYRIPGGQGVPEGVKIREEVPGRNGGIVSNNPKLNNSREMAAKKLQEYQQELQKGIKD